MRVCCVTLCCLVAGATQAAPRDYAYTWSTNVVAPKTTHLELWLSPRVNRVDESFFLLESKIALSLGISQKFAAQFLFEADFQGDKRVPTSVNPAASVWLHFAPFHHSEIVGLGVLTSVRVSEVGAQLGVRAIVDKSIGRLLLSLNASIEQRIFFKAQDASANTLVEGHVATRFQVNSQLRVGLEIFGRSAHKNGYLGTGFYVGPTVSVDYDTWFFSLGAMAQVAGDKRESERGNGEPLALNDNERFWFRVILGLKP